MSSTDCRALAFDVACGHSSRRGVAQPQPLAFNSRVAIDYIDPRTQRSQATLDRCATGRRWEDLAQFLSPLRLPRILRIRTKTCGVA